MEIKVVPGDIANSAHDVIILPYFENSGEPSGELGRVDEGLGGAISQLIKRGEIKGQYKEKTIIFSLGKIPSRKVAVIGMGKKAELTVDRIRVAVAEVSKLLRQKSPENIDTVAVGGDIGIDPETLGKAVAEGVMLGLYTFRRYQTKAPDYSEIRGFNIFEADVSRITALERGVRLGTVGAEATNLARDMINEPGNIMHPTRMAEIASGLAEKSHLEIDILDRDKMCELNMGGILGVSQGSQQPPRFIVLKYKGREGEGYDIALIGKGITFDSGGISLKPSENMGEMKGDMAGAAAVLGVISAIAQLKPRINLLVLVPATENLPSGTAMRPGDVITMMNGKTVEIISTDAEGRLILADGLCYARQQGASRMVDVATLTGTCRIALGDVCSGIFGNNRELLDKVISLGEQAGELMWPLPLFDQYKELNKSDVADIRNTGGRNAGATTAALFLKEFVESTPWVHLDIAGTSMAEKERGYNIKGGTGVTVRTLIDLVLALEKQA